MKKMLKRLFLLLVLTGLFTFDISGGGNPYKEKQFQERVEQLNRNKQLLSKLSTNLEEELTDLAYQDVDSIPIQSPISVIQLQRISSDYGMRWHPVHKDLKFHKGIDFVAPVGTEILATADGIIEKVVKSPHGYGNQVVIKHGYNYETRYAHLSNIKVEIGQKIKVGQQIGTLGSSGLTTGPHLHYEIINNNNTIDPMFFSYKDKENRSKDQYISTLIALETT